MKNLIARWQSKGGKTWIELYRDEYGYSYKGADCGGSLGRMTEAEAIAEVERRLPYFTPDSHKSLLKRVK